VRCEVLTLVLLRIRVFCDVTLCVVPDMSKECQEPSSWTFGPWRWTYCIPSKHQKHSHSSTAPCPRRYESSFYNLSWTVDLVFHYYNF